jgi:hypothetical protein
VDETIFRLIVPHVDTETTRNRVVRDGSTDPIRAFVLMVGSALYLIPIIGRAKLVARVMP